MKTSTAYLQYLFHFHGDRDYFECHEVLEEHWKNTDRRRDSTWVALIQIAVGYYHYRRGNIQGAKKLFKKVIPHIEVNQHEYRDLGLNAQKLQTLLYSSLTRIHKELPYISINLPLIDQKILEKGVSQCNKFGYSWGAPDINTSYFILHKHKLRNRVSM